jgi:hypothetical protein
MMDTWTHTLNQWTFARMGALRGLTLLQIFQVRDRLSCEPLSGHLFLFCNAHAIV